MSRSKLDPTHIAQMTFDEESEAMKVKMQGTEMEIELSADDGDSVRVQPTKLTASAMGCDAGDNNTDIIPAINCSNLSKVHVSVNGTGTVQIYASPEDAGAFWYLIGGAGTVYEICARRIKVKSVNAVGDVHLVGRS